ncbi:MAG: hypothetical protein EHM55_00340 [Acidobacteria bacterium]|nr:MAG: hypothetical protein EHM55_00340 [Acidobacteriota bacterium]
MRRDEPNPASAREQAEGSRENVDVEGPDERQRRAGYEDFESKVNLPGKTDSGPEPDIFGREIPPQNKKV